MDIVIITGLSGSGKSEAMDVLEDMGYYCIDNLPPQIIPKILTLGEKVGNKMGKIALGLDIRSFIFLNYINETLDYIEKSGSKYTMIFLEADTKTIIKRYKMSRRKHPLLKGEDIVDVIEKERNMLLILKEKSNYIIDTSDYLPIDLKNKLKSIFIKESKDKEIMISLMSFGFKYGLPLNSDLVFDVRFLPNPYYIKNLKNKNGNDLEVREYVMDNKNSHIFINKLKDMISFLIPMYVKEGKTNLVISIGCTGGKHRSVTICNLLNEYLKENGYNVFIKHRDYLK